MVISVVSCDEMGVWLAGCTAIVKTSEEVELVNWSTMVLDVSGIIELVVCSLMAVASDELELGPDTTTEIASVEVKLGVGSAKVFDEGDT